MLGDNQHIFTISCSLWPEHADYRLDLWSSEATLPLLWPDLCWNWEKMTARRGRTETGEKDEDEERGVEKMKGRRRRKGEQQRGR